VHANEVAAARAPDAVAMGFLAGEWDVGLPLDEIAGERDVFGDERIVLIPLPGHTRGTLGARIVLDRDGTFLLASDTVSLRSTLDTGVVPRNTWNADALTASLAEVRRIEQQGATVICGHDDAQWQSLRKGVDAYE
jgi:glyoxylase-like metal-dependent hydrolase (beta-lactamase superfamily II)